MSNDRETDYVLGTNLTELERLGLQHFVWRPTVLSCWQQAGITIGSRVIDVGAGPGYATVDLAEVVGPTGEVLAVERSERFVETGRTICQTRGLRQVRFQELDLMENSLPQEGFDAAWIRWVTCFVSSPTKLVESLSKAIRPGGLAIFHEYADYGTWRFAPRRPLLEEFVAQVMASWRAAAGEPDIALELPELLTEYGFRIRSIVPRVFCVRPSDHVWRWPATFLTVNLDRLLELKRVDEAWVQAIRREYNAAEADPNGFMITPMLVEIIAER